MADGPLGVSGVQARMSQIESNLRQLQRGSGNEFGSLLNGQLAQNIQNPNTPFNPFGPGTSLSGAVKVPPVELRLKADAAARAAGVPTELLCAVVDAESGWDPQAKSDVGAMGLMQLMPGTASDLGVTNPYDPEQNLNGGARYLRKLLDQFGDTKLALAAYNSGPGRVKEYNGIPPFSETQQYVNRIMARLGKVQ